MYNGGMQVEYDPAKASSNLLDSMALVREDENAEGEMRFVLVGRSGDGRLLTVCYTLRDEEETIRLISARPATRREERQYEERI